MKLTDYIIDFLVEQRIDHIFGLTGGGVVHLFDSADKHPKLQPIYCHHEQAAALAAVCYARIKNDLGAVIVTTGPGGTNTITGVLSAWQDSIPCVFISGQSRKAHSSRGKSLRQLGTQEFDIVTLVNPITKYASQVEDCKRIRYHLEKAVYLAKEGRPGPVWIDLPLDFHWANIDKKELVGFSPEEERDPLSNEVVALWCEQCCELLLKSERPLVLVGYGTRLAHAEDEVKNFLEKFKLPFISTWTASDIIPSDNPLYVGRLGINGQRGGNLAVQNCDLLICIGSHLSIPLTGTMFSAFAREAKIIMVDIDERELEFKTVKVDVPIHCDAKMFLNQMVRKVPKYLSKDITPWIERCNKYKSFNSIPDEWKRQEKYVNPYIFMDLLSEQIDNEDVVVVDGGGTNMYTSFQALKTKEGQRLTLSSSIGSMGTGLPESVGACFANEMKRTICLVGDGSMQLNIQELQTIVHHKLPIKIFVMNNSGYLAIRHTQDGFLGGNYAGSSETGGLSLPDYCKVATAYGLKSVRVHNHSELQEKIRWSLEEACPILCEIMISPTQQIVPRQGFDSKSDGTFAPRPLEDMYPYLSREEFLDNMIVEPWE